MTCIIGFVHDGKVYIGGDSVGVDSGFSAQIRADEKVFRNGEFIIGFTDSYRMGQLLRYVFTPPNFPEGVDHMKYMVASFIPAVRKCFQAGGYEPEEDIHGSFLVGHKGRLYSIESDYQVGLVKDNIAAVGSGAQVALGAMYALNTDPEKRILRSLEITSYLNAAVRPPFILEIC